VAIGVISLPKRSGLPKAPLHFLLNPLHNRTCACPRRTERILVINKVELVEAVQKQLGKDTSKAEAERAVTAVINTIKAGVKKAKMLQLVGFGTFKIVERKARKGVNLKTLNKSASRSRRLSSSPQARTSKAKV
jgi:DNA-binding protein HU-beta